MNRLMSFPLWGTGRPLLLDLRSSRRFFLTVVCVGVFVVSRRLLRNPTIFDLTLTIRTSLCMAL